MRERIFTLTLALVFTASLARSQRVDSERVSIAVRSGANLQKFDERDFDGRIQKNHLLPGAHFGIDINIPVSSDFHFQTGFLIINKGSKGVGETKTTTRLSYLEMPLNLVYKKPWGSGYLMLGFGPYVARGFGGHVTTGSGAVEFSRDVKFTDPAKDDGLSWTPYFERMDVGGNIFVGYMMPSGLFFQVSTHQGITKINPTYNQYPGDRSSIKNTGTGFSVGYRF
ncbi:outer membrane beta-barrel protein [uncultured Imperialibacter sp.]|uniref:outer membrane beta-barrel protein n=1 Tax=uncultured Imperialibacter sp. TaxID=1672639 RepID=UPI0030D9035E